MPNVFSYTDYRKFLSDWYQGKKKANQGFSYRIIANKVGFKSAGLFTMILKGKTNISIPLALRFADYIKLKKRETEYFQYMVLFNQARTHDEKKGYFEKMTTYKESAVRIIKSSQYAFYEKWYHSAIRAILDFYPFAGDYRVLSRMLNPPIQAEEARKSIELQENLGLIKKGPDGTYHPAESLISTGQDVQSMILNNSIIASLRKAKEAIDIFPKEKREHSCLTLGISQKGLDEIKQELKEFRRRVMEIAYRDSADTVYQFSLQIFPLSRSYRKRPKQ
ncbi:MAG: TIGR02147 family protein [Chitinivibrionales bacterium]|nr:TIGR02147 family protein [Chitinivibrionales bacterium]